MRIIELDPQAFRRRAFPPTFKLKLIINNLIHTNYTIHSTYIHICEHKQHRNEILRARLIPHKRSNVTTALQSLGQFLAQRHVSHQIAQKHRQQVPLLHSIRLHFIISAEEKKP